VDFYVYQTGTHVGYNRVIDNIIMYDVFCDYFLMENIIRYRYFNNENARVYSRVHTIQRIFAKAHELKMKILIIFKLNLSKT